MPMPFPQYVKIKDKYCCCYLGNSPEYVVALRILKDQIESQLPGLSFWIACKNEFTYLAECNVVGLNEFKQEDFAYVREIRNNNSTHSILDIIDESNIRINPIKTQTQEVSKLCLICPEGIYPTKSLNSLEIKSLTNEAVNKGYSPLVVGSDIHSTEDIKIRPKGKEKEQYINSVGWIIAVENEYLFLGAEKGIKTRLIKSGVGTNLIKRLFPLIEVV
jgi:hypothetical protein